MVAAQPQPRFISLRWRMLMPIFVVLLLVSMIGAYAIGRNLIATTSAPQTNLLQQSGDAVRLRLAELYEKSRLEAQRVAFTSGVAAAVRARAADDLQPVLESLARLSELDSVIVTDAQGIEVAGLLRTQQQAEVAYSVSTGTDLRLQSVLRAVIDESYVGAAGLVRTPQGMLLYTAVPLYEADELVGLVMVGQQMSHVLLNLKADGFVDLVLYDADGAVLQSTLAANGLNLDNLIVAPEIIQQALSLADTAALSAIRVGEQPFQAVYFSFQFGPQRLGVLGVLAPDNIPAIAQSSQQLTGLVLAAVAGGVIIALFLAMNRQIIGRAGQIATVAASLAAGNQTARTGLQAADEVSAVGHALDRYADYAQERHDALRTSLRRQRREAEFLLSVLETIPDGVVVQDQAGQTMIINDQARKLLGTQVEAELFPDLNTVIDNKLGKSIAPGLYALGDPSRLERNGRILTAQAAALLNLLDQRVGTVVVIRDVTVEVRREQLQQDLLQRLADEVHAPLAGLAHASTTAPLADVARSLSHHAAAIQKLISEMREITMPESVSGHEAQRPLYLDTFIWSVANEWRQVAAAAGLTLDVLVEKRGLFILGDERRLRWAVGNIVDNAIKYTLPGGKLTLEINGESGNRALMRVRDNGVGIAAADLPHIFTPYYRGKPRLADGEVLHVPGMGQGLSISKQIIEAHAGLVQLKSKPGVGTAAYFALPLTAAVGYELPLLPLESDLEGETVRLRSNRA